MQQIDAPPQITQVGHHGKLAECLHPHERDDAGIVAAVFFPIDAAPEGDHARCGDHVTTPHKLQSIIVVHGLDVALNARQIGPADNRIVPKPAVSVHSQYARHWTLGRGAVGNEQIDRNVGHTAGLEEEIVARIAFKDRESFLEHAPLPWRCDVSEQFDELGPECAIPCEKLLRRPAAKLHGNPGRLGRGLDLLVDQQASTRRFFPRGGNQPQRLDPTAQQTEKCRDRGQRTHPLTGGSPCVIGIGAFCHRVSRLFCFCRYVEIGDGRLKFVSPRADSLVGLTLHSSVADVKSANARRRIFCVLQCGGVPGHATAPNRNKQTGVHDEHPHRQTPGGLA